MNISILGINVVGGEFPFRMFDFASWFIPLIFIIVIGFIAFMLISNIIEWLSNNKKPVETDKAKVVTKREDVRRRSSRAGGRGIMQSRTHTTYYVTFELESGDRKEFKVKGKEYAMLADRDIGHLTFQGTRYHRFERVGTI